MSRCTHGLFTGWCPVESCEHYGIGEGHAPLVLRFVYCLTCKQATDPSTALPFHHGVKCPGCALCSHCGERPRSKRSRTGLCSECFAKLTAPKPCDRCGKPMVCQKPIVKHFSGHVKRSRHLNCSIDFTRGRMKDAAKVAALQGGPAE